MGAYKDKNTKDIHFTVNSEWWEEIEKTAESVGQTTSGFVRAAVVAYVKDCRSITNTRKK